MEVFLQIWAGGFYLLNKIFLSLGEGGDKRWQIAGWSIYLLGLPAWFVILTEKHDWIVTSTEVGGAPAMLLGLVIAWKGKEQTPRILKILAGLFAYGLLAVGIIYSLYDHRGLTSITQLLELCVTIGFLMGTYLLAEKKSIGWLFFALMNVSMATLMAVQSKPYLVVQQITSLGFVVWGYHRSQKQAKEESNDPD